MKKRLFALALCLVLATSLLPLTAAAAEWHSQVFVGLKDGGVYCEDVQFEFHPENLPAEWIGASGFNIVPESGSGGPVMTNDGGKYTLHVKAGVECPTLTFTCYDGSEREGPSITLKNGHDWGAWTSNRNGTHSRICGNGCVDSPQTEPCADTSPADCKCDDCGASMHTWQFKAAGNTLTGTCGGANCDIGEVSVTLEADSVILPKSPFETARLVGWNDFQTATGAGKEDFVYRYKGPGDERFSDPFYADSSRIKAGQYQVGVTITNLPGNVEDGNVAARANTDGSGNYAFLHTQYTAADPKVTAQTGDNRPIEHMLVSAAVFSALAAAAFIIDSRRKYSR